MFGIDKETYNIFKGASNTFFYYSLFYPKEQRKDIFDFYAFVRIADEFIDKVPQDIKGFETYKNEFITRKSKNKIINNFLKLEEKHNFKREWTLSFFHSIDLDTHKHTYKNQEEFDEYLYGIAEVIGLFISSILKLHKNSFKYAQLLGKAMQYANIIRDIGYDRDKLNRIYIPQQNIEMFELENLSKKEINTNKEKFRNLINYEADQYFKYLNEAEKGFKYIPKRSLIPIKSASDAYKLVINKIKKDPFQIFDKKIKPKKHEFYTILLKNLFYNPK